MGWSLSVYPSRNSNSLADEALLVVGKALYLANNFESKCHYVLNIFNLVSLIDDVPGLSLDDAVARLAKQKMLHPTLESLKKMPSVTPADAEALDKARHARNFIAHEGGLLPPWCDIVPPDDPWCSKEFFSFVPEIRQRQIEQFERTLANHLSRLRSSISELADGDNVVSRWVYEIEEKQPASLGLIQSYPTIVDRWVFGEEE